MENTGGIVEGKTHEECDSSGCGEPFFVTETGVKKELEDDEAVIIPEAFQPHCFADTFCAKPVKYKMKGTIKQIASAINMLGGGKNFAPGALVWKNGRKMKRPRLTIDNSRISSRNIKSGSVVINRENMNNPEIMTFAGTTLEIANAINTFGGNGDPIDGSKPEKFNRGGKVDNKSVLTIPEKLLPYKINRLIEEFLDNADENKFWSAEEKIALMRYSGYGGLQNEGDFSDEELKGLLYEYYTPDLIVKKMWALAYKYGYGTTNLSVLEPSVGTGQFLKFAPKDALIKGYDINPYSAKIASIVFPHANISVKSFEQLFINRNQTVGKRISNLEKYSLVIGNPPYGKAESKYLSMGEKSYTNASSWVEYFITRGIDLLIPGGLLIYIVGAEQFNGGKLFLDGSSSKVKEVISRKAALIDAYRLPANLFERTKISSEILVFKKL